MVPKTPMGQIIASLSSVCGIMMLALPLGVIANNFGEYEKYSKRRQKVLDLFCDNPFVVYEQSEELPSSQMIPKFKIKHGTSKLNEILD